MPEMPCYQTSDSQDTLKDDEDMLAGSENCQGADQESAGVSQRSCEFFELFSPK